MPTPSPPGVFVGAYASSPTARSWDPQLERAYLDRIAEIPGVRGLEVPWITSLHPHEENWYAEHLPAGWEMVITQIGGVMHRLTDDPDYGLASADRGGRARAVADVATIRDDVARLHDALGRQVVTGVELHSAPASTAARGTTAALAESLRDIAAWDWGGAEPLIEHCDERSRGRPTAKGFLSVAEELQAIADAATGTGMMVNWGRSAIELGDPDLVPEQVRSIREAGVLAGVVFSGVAAVATDYGAPWADAHPSFAPDRTGTGAGGSLLTDARATTTLTAAGPHVWCGLKVGCRPQGAPLEHRVALIRNGVERVLAARD
ncbi:DUF4862 family protein [Ruania alba]|uniref:DUF4862 family protein n=1 Tax=Ruania alba TaxID=648782 RepID=A0A1H5GQF3_9MICO|nr:DUF4862 family protein [Ruania alba]SEE17754.1 protein of unknown function [Ruania alba]